MRKLLGYTLLSLFLPILFCFFQLLVMKDMPLFENSDINLFLQAIIWGYIINTFVGTLAFLGYKGTKLIENNR